MNKEVEILKEWHSLLKGDLKDNTLTFDNAIGVGSIEGFCHDERVEILRFNLEMHKEFPIKGDLFKKTDTHIPIFFREPDFNVQIDLAHRVEDSEEVKQLIENGAFSTNSKDSLNFDFYIDKPVKFISVRLRQDYYQELVNESETLKKMFNLNEPFYVFEEFNALIGSVFLRAFSIKKSSYNVVLMHSVGIHLAAEFFNKLSEREFLAEENKYPLSTKAVFQARAILTTRWDKDLTIDVLARECGLSASRLRALYKQVFGITIHQFHNEVKLEVGRTMLLEGSKTISMIGVELGFSSASHFTTAFKKKFDSTPKEYQKKYQKI
ncbi:helix-turn-helix domain-containing protein [Flammeovirga kamogawensis]|uniref:Helix-turn-helix transcriptional regulator n=1 Tax=Flammeovirga kamogawensis TaxID=373891 RepID=A0ABX8H1L5_9BACT|nr:AraC family transcriptional regulator [Flammeovirga kamogawensis]MBB6463276.1 AraC-like DNA-binding protein [Flammeovirga kamogawensis]QWG09574.1 helix-turn-helix transcriptional regulator [Flammeovirga kamogawensis]TRX65088.1 helix-turn-helix transcriptional regulator [Flammeovirga kamogawensis]